jgi:hypothetical protein
LKPSAREKRKVNKDHDDPKQVGTNKKKTQRQVASTDYLSIPHTHQHWKHLKKEQGTEHSRFMK